VRGWDFGSDWNLSGEPICDRWEVPGGEDQKLYISRRLAISCWKLFFSGLLRFRLLDRKSDLFGIDSISCKQKRPV